MPKDGMAANATYANSWLKMQNAERRVASAFEHLLWYFYEGKRDLAVRLGVTGKGHRPCHKIVFTDANGREDFRAYDIHGRFDASAKSDKGWSTASMSIEEVHDLLGAIRGIK